MSGQLTHIASQLPSGVARSFWVGKKLLHSWMSKNISQYVIPMWQQRKMVMIACVFDSFHVYDDRLFPLFFTEYRSDEAGTTRAQTNKIILSFHLYGLEHSDKVVSVRVVFKHITSLPHFRATAYELKDNGFLIKLDSQVSDDGWVDLEVQDIFEPHKKEKSNMKGSGSKSGNSKLPMDTEHMVVLELTDLDSESASENLITLLHSLNPFIAVYTYDPEVYEHLSGGGSAIAANRRQTETTQVGRTISKRQVATRQGDTTLRSRSTQRYADLAQRNCQIHGVNTTVEELGWLSPNYEVIRPYTVNFTFCYGRCDRPLDLGTSHKYTTHARILNLLKPDLAAAGLAPCCVPSSKPEDTTSVQIIFLNGNVTQTTTMPKVKSCICQ